MNYQNNAFRECLNYETLRDKMYEINIRLAELLTSEAIDSVDYSCMYKESSKQYRDQLYIIMDEHGEDKLWESELKAWEVSGK